MCISSSPVRPSRTRAPNRRDPITTRSPVSRQRDQLFGWSPASRQLRRRHASRTPHGRRHRAATRPLARYFIPRPPEAPGACRHHSSRIKSACAGRAGADRQTHAQLLGHPQCGLAVAKGLCASGQLQLATIRGMTVIRKLARRRSQSGAWTASNHSVQHVHARITRIGWVAAGGWSACAGAGR